MHQPTSANDASDGATAARPPAAPPAVLPRQRAVPSFHPVPTPRSARTGAPAPTLPTQRPAGTPGSTTPARQVPTGLVTPRPAPAVEGQGAPQATPHGDPQATSQDDLQGTRQGDRQATPHGTPRVVPAAGVPRGGVEVADVLHRPVTAPPAHRRALRVVAGAAVVALVATATGGWVAQDRAHRQDVARAEARARVDAVTAAVDAPSSSGARVEVATWTDARSSETGALTAALKTATAALAATTHAPADARAALQRALDTARTTAADGAASLHALRTARAGLVAPQKAAQDGEKAWQTAEAERKAAEAAQRARQRVAAPPRTTTTGPGAGSAPVRRGIPAGGLVCSGTGGSGAREASASTLGAAINSYRASLGLPKLGVARSGSLTSHALDMGTRGGIWHSGGDNIVGCVGTSTASYLVQAWAHSPSHDKQMRRTDVSTMYVGAATQSGWLFGAVLFR
ncbi:hypothetical protein [Cellulomonas sp. PSBB021]|uniref:hypothetical protein n=1 Tax=Cellulomonas sp. PSBB021 TaxID=2003551 RepID=UPI0012FD06E3|nr:hypothetical protein [Cellulomonas sp. PSBB021]